MPVQSRPRPRRPSGPRDAVRSRDRRPDRGPRRVGDHRDPHRRGHGGRDPNLAREDARVLAILGAGVQGRAPICRRSRALRYWTERRVYAPTIDHARAIADEVLGGDRSRRAPREAVDGADVVVTATSSREPVIERGWLASGRARERRRREQPRRPRDRRRDRRGVGAVLRQPRVGAQRGGRVPPRRASRARSPATITSVASSVRSWSAARPVAPTPTS